MDDTVVEALTEHTHPLSTADPDAGHADPDRLGPFFEDADVVALGEATHGTREFFAVRHRLTRYLVEHCGLRTVAIEAEPGDALPLADYVAGEGDEADLPSALGSLSPWWRTEGMASFCRWLRSYNEGLATDDRVRFYGIDVGDPSTAATAIRSFRRDADHDLAGVDRKALDRLAAGNLPSGEGPAVEEFFERAESIAGGIADGIDRYRDGGTDRSARDLDRLEHLARSLAGTCEWYRAGGAAEGFSAEGYERRDRVMADNVARLAREREDKTVLWAHNGHVMCGTFDDGRPWSDRQTAGENLRGEFGDAYRPVGTDTHRGTVRAADAREGREGFDAFGIESPPESSLAATLAGVDRSPALLDLRAAGEDPRLSAWFDRPRRIRNVEVTYDPTGDHEYYAETDLLESFDGVVFVEETGAARPVDSKADT